MKRFKLIDASRAGGITIHEHEDECLELATEFFILWLNSHLCPPALRRDDEEPARLYNLVRCALTFKGPTYYAVEEADMADDNKKEPVHIMAQLWVPEIRDDGVYLVGALDKTTVLKMARPDRDSDLLMAGYIAALQSMHLQRKTRE